MFSQGQSITSSNLDDFILQDKIGSGSFGKVYRVKDKRTKEIFAAKISINAINKDTYDLFMSISREVSIISKLNHPSILKFIIYSPVNFKKKMKPVIITEYAPNGSLMDLIEHDRSFPDNQILNDTHKLIIIYGIASAMSYLHSHDILHRDLKPDNVLIDNSFLPKVADFGLSKNNIKNSQSILTQTMNGTLKGTPKYMSPEIWSNAEYSKSSDVYAFAITVYEIITLEKPFQDMIIYRVAYDVQKGERPKIDDNVPKVYMNLIKRCWSQEASKRPTFDQIITEMKTNKEYLLDTVNENDFSNYIKFIDDYKITFDSNKSVLPTYNLNKYISSFNKENEIKDNELIQNINNISNIVIQFPWKYLKEIGEESMEIVKKAENGNLQMMYKVGISLIEGRYDFPIDVEVGINFLKSSMNKGYKESFFYFIEMLIKGKYIPQNHTKARKLIEHHFSKDKSSYFYLLGKLYKKEKLFREAEELFLKSINEGSIESMSQYAELIEKEDEGKSEDFYKKGIEHGDLRCIFKYGIKLKNMKEKSKQEEGDRLIKEAVERGYNKAIYYYGTELEKEEDDDNDNEYDVEETDYNKYKEKNRKEEDNKEKVEEEEEIKDDNEKQSEEEECKDDNERQSEEEEECKDDNEKQKEEEKESNDDYDECKGKLEEEEEINDQKSLKYFKQAAYEGHVKSIYKYSYQLLKIYEYTPNALDKREFIRNLKKAINKGCIKAMYEYGYILCQGDMGIQAKPKEGSLYVIRAAVIGNAKAMAYYANLLIKGQGVQTDIEKGIEYFKKGVSLGSTTAMNDFAYFLEEGMGDEPNYEEAIKYYKMAIDHGCIESMYNYALMLEEGRGVEVNYKEAIKYYKMAISHDDSDSMYRYGRMLEEGRGVEVNFKEAFKYYKMAIDLGHTYTMTYCGFMYEYGKSVEVNYQEAIKYYKMGIDNNESDSMYRYACMLRDGKGVDVNYEESFKYFKLAIQNVSFYSILDYSYYIKKDDIDHISNINQEDPKTIYKYAYKLENGICCDVNIEEAIKYYKKGIQLKNTDSMYRYARMLAKGIGVKVDDKESVKMYKMAIENDFYQAMTNYAKILWNGDGVEKNKDKAIDYFKEAILNDNIEAMRFFGKILIDEGNEEEGNELIKRSNECLSFESF